MKETTRIIEVLKRVDEITSIKTKTEMYCLHYIIFVSKDIGQQKRRDHLYSPAPVPPIPKYSTLTSSY